MSAAVIAVGAVALLALAGVAALGWDRRRLQRELAARVTEAARRDEALAGAAAQAQARAEEAGRLREELAATRAQASEFEKRREDLLAQFRGQEERFKESFKALAADALKHSSDEFLRLAQQRFETDREKARASIEALVKPIDETLKKQDTKLAELERSRIEQSVRLQEQVRMVGEQALSLQQETGRLTQSLKASHVRGRWGELTLRRVAELAGMSEHCDFVEQGQVAGVDGPSLRPDMVVRLPGGRDIVVDAKTPLSAFLESIEAADEPRRAERLRAHARQVRDRADELASKEYQKQFGASPEVTVMFVPGDQFLAAALREQPDLIEHAMSRGVVIATPATLFALIRAVAFGWSQATLADDARAVLALGREIHERISTLTEHLERTGKALDKAVDAYNDMLGNIERRVLPSARRLTEHNVRSTAQLAEAPVIVQRPRLITPAGDAREG